MKISVQQDNFNIQDELDLISNEAVANNESIGAISSFIGLVRDVDSEPKLVAMTLEHYPKMTEKKLYDIGLLAKEKFKINSLTIIHRYGCLKINEQIVLVITSSGHRKNSMEACQFIMDYLKTNAPFWKKETYNDGSTKWVVAKSSDDNAVNKWD